MKKLLLVCLGCILTVSLFSQKKAVTDTGEEVILYEDGTWKYVKESDKEKTEIPTNPATFTKSSTSSFLVKSKTMGIGVWIDTKKLSFKKGKEGEAAEYEFELKGKDVYGMIITEATEVPLPALKEIALENAQEEMPDIRIVKEEYRNVNGKKMLFLQMDGSTRGIKFSYCGYYYSDASGTAQFVLYTSQSLVSKYKSEMEEILNGMAVVN